MDSQHWGLSDAGFKPKDFATIQKELETSLRKEVDPSLHFGPGSVAGVLTAIMANQSRQVWESLAGLYTSLQPDTASGRALDALCSLTGTYRRQASYSRANAKMTLDANTTLSAGSRIQTVAGDFFKTVKEVSNTTNSPTDIEAELIAEKTGPRLAYANTQAKIMTPTAGWTKAELTETHQLGRHTETDTELRLRRIAELKASGSSTADGMKSRLLQLEGVEAVHIREGKQAFEAIIKGGEPQEIAKIIWNCKPLGVRAEGRVSENIEDEFKQTRRIRFSRPKEIPLTLQAELRVRRRIDGTALKTSLAGFARKSFRLGAEVYVSRFVSALLDNEDVLDVVHLDIRDRATGNTSPTLINEDEIASLNLNDIYIEQSVEGA